MATRAVCLAVAAACGAVALLSLAPVFVPGLLGSRPDIPPALRSQYAAQAASASASSATTVAAAVLVAAVGAGVLHRMRAPTRVAESRIVQCAARRDLAIAYEDSGIELLDNGKFAQGLVGSEGAWGKYEFDPAGFSKNTEFMPFIREAELKHGRIAMLAWIGLVVPDFVRLPGEQFSFEAIPLTIDAHDKLNGAIGVNFQIVFWLAVVEFCCCKKVFEFNSLEVAGDYGLGAQFLPKDEEGQRRMRLMELKNARLAMVAFGGAITQAVLTRHPFPWLF